MRTDKVMRVLLLYHQLLHGHKISKTLFCMEHNIDARSFDRDIKDIRLFLSESYAASELHFDKANNVYYLVGQHMSQMEAEAALIFGKLLLQSGLFRQDETEGLLSSLCSTVPKQKQRVLQASFDHDLRDYKSPEHGSAILKILNDLTSCILNRNPLRLTYIQENGVCSCVEVAPMELLYRSPRIYLCTYPLSQPGQVENYAVDRIRSFEVLLGSYPHKWKQIYKNTYKGEEILCGK